MDLPSSPSFIEKQIEVVWISKCAQRDANAPICHTEHLLRAKDVHKRASTQAAEFCVEVRADKVSSYLAEVTATSQYFPQEGRGRYPIFVQHSRYTCKRRSTCVICVLIAISA